MKTMKDFAAQQLSKKQMNEVMGGQQMICFYAEFMMVIVILVAIM